MALVLDDTGVQIDTLEEIIARLTLGFQNIYGNDINVEPNSPDGQRIGIFAKEIYDSQVFGEQLYAQIDPDTAVGTFADNIFKWAGIVRRPDETIEAFRRRRLSSLQSPAQSTLGGILARLINLDSITDIAGHENNEDTQDTERDIAPHTIWLIIDGTNPTIPEVITKNLTGGTGLKGSVTGTYVETIARPNLPDLVLTHNVRYSNPVSTPLHIRMNARRRTFGAIIDEPRIRQSLVNMLIGIEDVIDASQLYATAYLGGDNFILHELEISTDGVTYSDEALFPGYGSRFVISEANIDITVEIA